MFNGTPTLEQLREAVVIKEKIAALEIQLAAIIGGSAEALAPSKVTARRGRPPGKVVAKAEAAVVAPVKAAGRGRGGRREMSPEAKARIAAAQKKRWAKFHESQGTVPKSSLPKKRGLSPAGRASLAAAQKERWAKFRAQKGAK